ncbi:MAG: hypothetical protein HC781_01680 [Leptolyngbyaceae cyanobacterium CSU_1_4]|nr:hypothetical protein [Leptolyngbyaceae cyanobacterium CSU_1_4]
MIQLDLLDYQPAPEELAPPPVREPPNPHLVDWLNGSLLFYIRLMGKYMDAGIAERDTGQPNEERQKMRRHMISHISLLREQLLERLRELEGD